MRILELCTPYCTLRAEHVCRVRHGVRNFGKWRVQFMWRRARRAQERRAHFTPAARGASTVERAYAAHTSASAAAALRWPSGTARRRRRHRQGPGARERRGAATGARRGVGRRARACGGRGAAQGRESDGSRRLRRRSPAANLTRPPHPRPLFSRGAEASMGDLLWHADQARHFCHEFLDFLCARF